MTLCVRVAIGLGCGLLAFNTAPSFAQTSAPTSAAATMVAAAMPVHLATNASEQSHPEQVAPVAGKAVPAGVTAVRTQSRTILSSRDTDEKQLSISFIPSLRVDLLGGDPTALHFGVGVLVGFPGSNYFTIGGTAAIGGGEDGLSGRGDLYGRISLDPYRQLTWEPYIGAGVTTIVDRATYLLAFAGLDGPKVGPIKPGVEIGVGGAFRLGVTIRFAE